MADNVSIVQRELSYNSAEVQALLDIVRDRSFFRDMTEEEYETLGKAERENGDLYLLHEDGQ